MIYSYKIRETFYNYRGEQFKAIQLKVVRSEGKFEYRGAPLEFSVNDGGNSVKAFFADITPNQKELTGYFTVDAFTGFSGASTIRYGYDSFAENLIDDADVLTVDQLPALLAIQIHLIADKAWLSTL